MAGGTWTTQNKILPGVYFRFKTRGGNNLTISDRGTVAIAKELDWGAYGTIVTLTGGDDPTAATGYDLNADANYWLRQIFTGTNRTSGGSKVYLYRLPTTSNAAATATIGDNLTVTAKYAGTRGNALSVAVTALPDEGFTVTTMLDGETVDEQTGAVVADLTANDWVTFSGTGDLEANTGTALTGGANGTLSTSAHSGFLTAIEPYKFDIITYDGTDTTTKGAYANFVKRIADEDGLNAQFVGASLGNTDSRFCINVTSGGKTDTGVTLTAAQMVPWVAGAMAGAMYNESITNATVPGLVDVNVKKTNAELEAAVLAGELALYEDGGIVRVVQDINTLVTYTQDIGKPYHKNRVMRLCNTIANDLYAQFVQNYVGIVDNNDAGRALFRGAIIGYLNNIQATNGIQNFTADDVEVLPGDEIDAIVVNLLIQPVDAVEKIYITVTVSA